MTRIAFPDKEARIRGFYLLATKGVVRSLRGGIFEIRKKDKGLLDREGIAYKEVKVEESADEAEAIRNSLTPGL